MRLVILRHGESVCNKSNVLAGWKNVCLTNEGRYQSKNVCKILKNINFEYIFTSDLERAIETSCIIQKELNQNSIIKYSYALKEKDYGVLSGESIKDLEKVYGSDQVKKWRKSYWITPPNGESLNDVKCRFGSYFDNHIKPLLYRNHNILIVSHSSALKALLVHLRIKNEKTVETFDIPNCKPIEIDINCHTFKYID